MYSVITKSGTNEIPKKVGRRSRRGLLVGIGQSCVPWNPRRPVAHAGTWLVLIDPKVAELAGLGSTDVAAADVVNVANALQWVAMLAALYVKAAAK